jgi:hypothetical protein
MCPACIATAAPAVAGVTSTGGPTVRVRRTLRVNTDANIDEVTTQTGGKPDGSPESRVTS